jgi:16S rRNA G966 N2-methylase RsmD
MYEESFSKEEKEAIANSIKNIVEEDIGKEFNDLKQIGRDAKNKSDRCRIGNNVVDFFTFKERLETRGKYNVNFYEFIANIEEFKKKKFIGTMLDYYDKVKNKNGTKNKYIVWKETYNICISAINIFRPIFAMEIYDKYKANMVLDFCAGWGGRAVGAGALNLKKYVGVDINTSLKEPYSRMKEFLKTRTNTEIDMIFGDALDVDYSLIEYDMVFTSPPYYFLEKYENNVEYKSKKSMNELFYRPLFEKTYKHLQEGGHYILNINKEIYDSVCLELLGPAYETFPLKKSKRQNNYTEYVYVWIKNGKSA